MSGTTARAARHPGRRAVAGLVLTAAVAFLAVGGAAWVVAHRIARADALAESLRTARAVGRVVVTPALPAVLGGDDTARARLGAAVAARRRDGTLVRVDVRTRDGTVAWSDDASLIGRRLPVDGRLAAVFDRGRDYAALSTPDGRWPAGDRGRSGRLVETYQAVRLGDGRTVAVGMSFPGTRVERAEDGLGDRLVPFALLSLLVLVLAQLPVSVWLVRRVVRSQRDRDRMLEQVLVSAERERRRLARDLHDGVIQDLAGATLALGGGQEAVVLPAHTGQLLRIVTQTLQQAVGTLREILVELHPKDLGGDNLADVIASCAVRACPDQQVTVRAAIDRPLGPETAAFLYRCARECADNVARHAAASRVGISLATDRGHVRLDIEDDGVGPPPGGVFARPGGGLGLALLRQAASDLGGSVQVEAGPGGRGTAVRISLPL